PLRSYLLGRAANGGLGDPEPVEDLGRRPHDYSYRPRDRALKWVDGSGKSSFPGHTVMSFMRPGRKLGGHCPTAPPSTKCRRDPLDEQVVGVVHARHRTEVPVWDDQLIDTRIAVSGDDLDDLVGGSDDRRAADVLLALAGQPVLIFG